MSCASVFSPVKSVEVVSPLLVLKSKILKCIFVEGLFYVGTAVNS